MSLEGGGRPVLSPAARSFRNVVFDIAPGGEVGTFDVHASFLGVDMEHFRLHYQVRGRGDTSRTPPGFSARAR